MVRPRPPPCQPRGSLRLRAAPPRRTHTPLAPLLGAGGGRSAPRRSSGRHGGLPPPPKPWHGPRRCCRAPFARSTRGAEAVAAAEVRGAPRQPPRGDASEVPPTRLLSLWHSHCAPFPTAEAPLLEPCLDCCPKLALELAGTRFLAVCPCIPSPRSEGLGFSASFFLPYSR